MDLVLRIEVTHPLTKGCLKGKTVIAELDSAIHWQTKVKRIISKI
jgi:hypothetical protein